MLKEPPAVSEDKDIKNAPATAKTTRLVVLVEYNGSRYHGLQLQKGPPTIQGELEKALKSLTGKSIRVAASSRTDSGQYYSGAEAGQWNGITAPLLLHNVNMVRSTRWKWINTK